MFTSLQTQLKRASRLLPVALLSSFAAHAQLGYSPTTAVNAAGTYTDLAATGTAISTANTDDANSTAQGIGFTFTFNGTAFTQFVLNTNGFIKLGATAPSAADLFLPESMTATQIDPFESTNAADVNILAPFNFDLMAGTAAGGTEYRVATTGTAPNRVCTIQWKNVADKTLEYDQQYGSMNFQVKLYETTNNIEFVYGTAVQGTLPNDYRFAVVGIKGSSITNNQSIVVTKPGTGTVAWSAATFSTGFYTTDAFNYSGNVRPDAGRTYRFAPGTVPTAVNDDPTTAITLTLGTTCTPTNGTNVNATTTTANGYTNGTNPNAACGIAVNPKDVWYKFTTAASGAGSTSATIQVTGNPAGYLRAFSTTGGAAGPFTEIGCASGGTNNTVSAPLALTGLTPNTTYYISVAGYGSGDTQGAFTICITAPAANDAAVTTIYTLGTVSSAYGSPVTAQVVVTNAGSAVLTALPVTLTVSGGTTYTNTQTVASLAVGASTTLTFTYPVTGTTGTNTLTATVPADAVATNNSKTATQTITRTSASHFPAGTTTYSGGIGSNTTANILLLARYSATPATTITTVTPTFLGTTASTYQVVIYGATATGTPGTLLYTSPTRTRPAVAGPDAVTIPGTAVSGDFYVGVKQLTTTNIGLAFLTDSPLRPATFFISADGTTFSDLVASTLSPRLAIDVTFSTPTAARNQALAATVGLAPNPAHGSFQLLVPAGNLHAATATLSNALGQTVLVRQLNLPAAGGTADFNVSNLANGVYSLTLKSGNDVVVKRVVVE
ncbi:T9SS type A sorting domain-containing protein [Hymenobacter convexus]|uniref:T9SS type A sorting domain-containing protein n=1 Tax=Hymenobacter sp. CA1UV-4 TaxID=3063782 RepID=UPI0027133601|nr:T9SS type A sorting domain-containing protein [Hymenobacter sp. CA1UV-4]MDO7853907.1 T9SS type A sorting domain-containing protein [Hymenobacter sp. CA1UV-4]